MNNEENIIKETREKIKNNPKYVNPMSKIYQEDIKRYGFENGYRYSCWLQKVGILRHPTDIKREVNNISAKNRGFKDSAEALREYLHRTGRSSPMSENVECTTYFGIWIAENYIFKTFEDADKAPYGTIGYDWICNKGMKIQCKARCLDSSNRWNYNIANRKGDYNTIADYFIISAWDNRESLNPLHVWVFHRDDIIRGKPFLMRLSISISNTENGLEEFKEFEVTNRLDKLKQLCNKQ